MSKRIHFRRTRHRNALARLLGTLTIFGVGLTSTSSAQVVDWTNASGGNFAVGSNWFGGSVPSSTQIAKFGLAGSNIAIGFTNPTTTRGLIITDGDYTFNLDGHTFALLPDPAVPGANSFRMGTTLGETGSLSLVNGTLSTVNGSIGERAGTTQNLYLKSGGIFHAGHATVGTGGTGTINIGSGGTLIADILDLGGNVGSNGKLILNGTGASATSKTSTLGVSGASQVFVFNGQLNTQSTRLADKVGSSSSVRIDSNGEWVVTNANVTTGEGSAFIDISKGGVMNANNSRIFIGNSSGATSSLQISGGTLNIDSQGGSGGLTIQNNGSMSVVGTLNIGGSQGLSVASGGVVDMSDGTINTTNFDMRGTLNLSSGNLIINGGDLFKSGAFDVSGGTGNTSVSLINGATTHGIASFFVGGLDRTFLREFNVLSGSTLSNRGDSIVGFAGSGSTMRVSGSGSTWKADGVVGVGFTSGALVVEKGGQVNTFGNSLVTGMTGATSNGSLLIQSGGGINAGTVELARAVGSNSSATVTGVGSSLQASGLYVGGNSSGSGGTAKLLIADGANVTVNGETVIHVGGTLNLAGGSLATQSFTRNGTLNFSDGTLNIAGGVYSNLGAALSLAGTNLNDNPTLVLEGNASTFGMTAINVGNATRMGTVTVNNGSLLSTGSVSIASRGTLNLNGGTLNLNSFTNHGAFHWNSGTVNYANDATLDSSTLTGLLGSSHRLADNQTLASSSGTITLGSALTVDGGTLRPTNFVNNSTMTVNAGNVEVASNFTNNANRIVQLNGTSSLSAAGAINNSGSIQLTSAAATISGGAFTNLTGGTVSGSGTIYNDIGNRGTIRAMGSEHLVLAGGSVQNLASINLSGGTLEVANTLVNRDGAAITGRGTFVGSSSNPGGLGLTNDGVLSFSSGNADIYGDVNQTSNGRVVTSGGGVTTFYDDVVHNGAEIRTFEGSRTVFLGAESGAGNFTGTGVVEFAGDLRPGNSPASIAFGGDVQFNSSSKLVIELGGLNPGQFDQLLIAGNLSLDGKLSVSLINGFTLDNNEQFLIGDIAGSRLGLFNGLGEGALVGNFSGHDLYITYEAGNGNDIALITAVPEPGTIGLIGLAMVGGVVSNLRRKWSRKSV